MPEQVKAAGSGRHEGELEDSAELVETIARQKEEILRLRDLLIVKDAELGAAKGSLAELTEHSARFAMAVRAVQARIPGPLRRVLAGLRRRG